MLWCAASGVHEVTIDIPAAAQAGFIRCSTRAGTGLTCHFTVVHLWHPAKHCFELQRLQWFMTWTFLPRLLADQHPPFRESTSLTLSRIAPAEQRCPLACWEWDATCSLQQKNTGKPRVLASAPCSITCTAPRRSSRPNPTNKLHLSVPADVCFPCTGAPILDCKQTTCTADDKPYIHLLVEQLLGTCHFWVERLRQDKIPGCLLWAIGLGLFLLGATVASRIAPQNRLGHTRNGESQDHDAWEMALFQLSHNLVPTTQSNNFPTLYYKCTSRCGNGSSLKRHRMQQPVWGRDVDGRLMRHLEE